MSPAFCTFGFLLLLLIRKVESVTFQQSSPLVVKEGAKELKIDCSHDDSSLQVMLWYQQQQSSRSLSLIGYIVLQGQPVSENEFKDRFLLKRVNTKNGSLIINTATLSDSAVYFCAASRNTEAYFGGGTKLTVLDPNRNITEPKVKVLRPSRWQCRKKKEEQIRKKTLVCVASGFYPDHVTVSWKINSEDVSTGVATDSAAHKDKDYYRITSTLTINTTLWENKDNSFMCLVSFFNGETTIYRNDTLHVKGKGEGISRGEYLKVTQSAKLSYVVVIIKSCIYGLFVGFFVWKLQSSSEKHK